MSSQTITTDKLKAYNYSRYENVDDYLCNLKGEKFLEYRKRWKAASSMEKEFDFPVFLVFETMFKCNLKCIMCYHSNSNKSAYDYDGRLPTEAFERIMKECSGRYSPSLTIGGTSEPLLDVRLPDMLALARDSGFMDTMINTNATLLSESISRKLIKSGLTRIRIGFDGATAETYEKIRIGASFHRVKDNILNFIKIRNKMGSRFPIVRVSCVHLSENDKEIQDFITFWKPHADYVSIQRYKPHEFTEDRERDKMGAGKRVIGNVKCSQPFERLYIRGNGDVHACCSMVYGPRVGSIFNSSVSDIWNSEKMKQLRWQLKNGTLDKIPTCKACMIQTYGAV
jgi:radical SAM protein with 4Fe4S-binding SPASM domain